LQGVVDDHGELIRDDAVASSDHDIPMDFRVENNRAEASILHGDRR